MTTQRRTTAVSINQLSTLLMLSALLASVAAQVRATAQTSAPHAYALSGEYRGTHDPSIMKEGDTYYVFATGTAYAPAPPSPASDLGAAAAAPNAPGSPAAAAGRVRQGQLAIRCSHDLQTWTRCGAVFADIPEWIKTASPATKELWAPDISFFDGIYHLYYAYSAFGVNTSGIALATNKTLDSTNSAYKWVDQGSVLKSTEKDDFNAIDPNLIIDQAGQTWLTFGSFWSGIKMRRVDRKTGLPSTADTKIYSLASRARPTEASPAKPGLPPDWEAIEAPFLIRHDGYYYLFVSWDLCCRGTKSTYKTVVGRASSVTGPYADKDGKAMTEGGGTTLLASNSKWVGPGGESILQLPGQDIIVFHAYDAQTGRPALHISTISWADGWPAASLEGDGQ